MTGNSALHWAAKTGNVQLTHMLLSAGFEVNAQNNAGETPLHIAAKENKVDAFKVQYQKKKKKKTCFL